MGAVVGGAPVSGAKTRAYPSPPPPALRPTLHIPPPTPTRCYFFRNGNGGALRSFETWLQTSGLL
jgi:hypothetical protein